MSSVPLIQSLNDAAQERAAIASDRTAYQVRLVKIVCAVLLGIAFWFAVPYYLPLKLDPDPMKAAANEAVVYEGNLSRQIAMPAILMIAAYMLWRLPQRGRFTKHSKLMMLGLGYVGWAISSALWSVDPGISSKRLIVFFINIVFIYALARCASMLEIALFGFTCTGTVALISLGVDIFVQHSFAPFDPDYRFMGVMTANFQAMNLVVCLLCGLTVLQRRPKWLIWTTPLLALFVVLLVLTRARVGSFLCIGLTAFMLVRAAKLYLQPQTRARAALGVALVLVFAAALAIAHSGTGAVTEILMMGRKDTQNTASLSNRAPLWSELMESFAEHPVLGFGFEAFWSPERVEKISFDQGWMVPHAHNTYLDQALSLGVIGSFLYACTVVGGCFVGWRRFRRYPDEGSLLIALLLTWLALLSLSESIPIAPNLPTLIAYTCLVKLCMAEGSDAQTEAHLSAGEILRNGRVLQRQLPPRARVMEGSDA